MPSILTEITAPTFITEGSQIQGDLTFQSIAQVHGLVEGEIHQQSYESLSIGREGWVKGNIQSIGPVSVEGRVEGDIGSSTKIRLSGTACVRGILNAPQIEVRPGALFDGEFHMKSSKIRQPSKRAA